jgi:hypothetical protein
MLELLGDIVGDVLVEGLKEVLFGGLSRPFERQKSQAKSILGLSYDSAQTHLR